MFEISIFVAILVTIIGNSEAKVVPIKTNGSDTDYVLQPRIFGGKWARLEQSQYTVALYHFPYKNSQRSFLCGGTLISKQYVLTAAHCLVDGNNTYRDPVTVYLGARNPENQREKGRKRYNVAIENFILYEYDTKTNDNDIALIKLPKPVKFNKYIKPARLPNCTRHTKENLLGKTIIASGWGATKAIYEMPEHLLSTKTKIQQAEVCRLTYGVFDDDQRICINAEGKSVCPGDSGGPNIYEDNGVNYVVGVTSSGPELCVKGLPQILTRVSHYLDWIAKNTGLRV